MQPAAVLTHELYLGRGMLEEGLMLTSIPLAALITLLHDAMHVRAAGH